MHKPAVAWGRPVGGLFAKGGRQKLFPTTPTQHTWLAVYVLVGFYVLLLLAFPNLFHYETGVVAAVVWLVLPTIHTTYNKQLHSIYLVINSGGLF